MKHLLGNCMGLYALTSFMGGIAWAMFGGTDATGAKPMLAGIGLLLSSIVATMLFFIDRE